MNQRPNSGLRDSGETGDPHGTDEFRLLVEAVTEYAIFRLDSEGRVVSWNAGAEKIKGHTAEDIIGHHFSVFYTEEDIASDVPQKALESAAREGVWTSEGWRIRKDGTRFWAHVTITALFGEDGTLRGFAKVTRDMTERHEHEKRLKQERRRAEREKALLQRMQAIAIKANDADSLDGAMQVAVEAVCQCMGWPVGHVYRTIRSGETWFVPTGIWHLNCEERFGRFREVTGDTTFPLGENLPSRVATSGAPVWIQDVTDAPDFARAQTAESTGMKGAFGVPVSYDGETVAVLEFFSAHNEEPDEVLFEALESVGVQLSRVAEREAARKTIRRSDARYRRLFEDAQEGIAISTPEGKFIDVNPAAQEILGYSREELMAMNVADLYADPKERKAAAELVAREGAARNLELRGHHKNGRELIVEVSTTVRRNSDGEATAYLTLLRDITERKRAEEALKESEAKFRALADQAPTGVLLIQDGRLEYANEALVQMYGFERAELEGGVYAEMLVHQDDRDSVQDHIERRLSGTEKNTHFRFRGRTKDGETIQVKAYGTRIEYQGRPAIIGMDVDVTDQMRLQREVLSTQDEERRRLGRDLHDGVVSQITNIGLMIDVIRHRVKNGQVALGEIPGHLKDIQDRVIESGKDARQLSHGLAPAGLTGKELPEALARLAKNIEGGRFEHTATGLPEQGETTTAHLYRIAQEAVTNAQKHAEADRITIRLRRENGFLVLESEDDGRGFDASTVQKHSLGLRTMRYRAELLGGTLTINTAPGEGTRVCCRVRV